jgi:polyhydroxybutyrate depolymerase
MTRFMARGDAMWKALLMLALLALPAQAEERRVALGARFYLIDLPARPTGAMILALHGAGGTPGLFARNTGLGGPATAQGYAVIYPAGSGPLGELTWNAFYCCGAARSTGVDDMAFLDQVISDAARRFGLDPARVYLTGMSNGSMMAETYAVRRPGQVKAVAGVSGTLDLDSSTALPVPLLHIHGTADQVVPYDGGPGRSIATAFTSVPAEIAAFLAVDGPLARSSRVIDPVDDGMSVTEDDYRDAQGISQLRLLTIRGGRHVWPNPDLPQSTRDIDGATEVLRFFAEHP